MQARSLIVPGLVFVAGAVFGRLFGLKPLVRGAMAAATMGGMLPDTERAAPRRAVSHRPARRRSPQKRSSKAA